MIFDKVKEKAYWDMCEHFTKYIKPSTYSYVHNGQDERTI